MIFLFLRCFLSVPTLVWVAVLHSCAVTSCTVVFAHLFIVPHASVHPSIVPWRLCITSAVRGCSWHADGDGWISLNFTSGTNSILQINKYCVNSVQFWRDFLREQYPLFIYNHLFLTDPNSQWINYNSRWVTTALNVSGSHLCSCKLTLFLFYQIGFEVVLHLELKEIKSFFTECISLKLG